MKMAGYGKISATSFMIRRGIVLASNAREKPKIEVK